MTTESALALIEQQPQIYAMLNHTPSVSPEVLSAIYTDHYRHVLQVCRGFFRQREDAEDAAAEVFLKLYRVLHQKDQTVPFRPWVSRVAGHHCIDKLRRKKSENSSSLEDVNTNDIVDHSTPSALSEILRKESERRIREELARLPEKHRVALVLRYYQRMSYSEIARALNMRLPSVRVMLFRARRYLSRNLRRPQKPAHHRTFIKVG